MQGVTACSDRTPDIVIHGHSHKYGVREEDGLLFINPGSAGPARFKLPRTAAVLELRPKVLSLLVTANIPLHDVQSDYIFRTSESLSIGNRSGPQGPTTDSSSIR